MAAVRGAAVYLRLDLTVETEWKGKGKDEPRAERDTEGRGKDKIQCRGPEGGHSFAPSTRGATINGHTQLRAVQRSVYCTALVMGSLAG